MEGHNMEHRDWRDVREELNDVCRSCKSAVVPHPNPSRRSTLSPVVQSQWLVQKHISKSILQFFHPFYKQIYSLYAPELSGEDHLIPSELFDDVGLSKLVDDDVVVPPALLPDTLNPHVLCFSKDGWLLLSQGRFSKFLLNPFTGAKIFLPDIPESSQVCSFIGVTILSELTSPDCLIFGISAILELFVNICIIRRGEEEWSVYSFKNNLPIVPSACTPVFHKGMFYCLGELGNLGVFDPKDNQWTVLSNPRKPCKQARENYLLECEGELMSVFIGRMGLWISIFKLNESKMEWEEVTDLGDNTLFLSVTTSFSTKKVINGTEKNRIYLPRFYKGYIVFYSLSTQKYHTLGNDFSSTNLYQTEELLECSWIEPRADQYSNKQLDWFAS